MADKSKDTSKNNPKAGVIDSRTASSLMTIWREALYGERLKFFGPVLRDLALLWILLIGANYILSKLLPLEESFKSCFKITVNICQVITLSSLIHFIVFAVCLFAGSFFSTRLTKTGKFQRSALICALFILTLILALYYFAAPFLLYFVLLPSTFVAFYSGYRLALR
ncbi:MAG: hypothetical protein D6719_01030 [Candidatus Dadabacteria bacterium]|nr:MAG: hypothetical protein D6719_01030 [Candidatus Dadabacteria bacterium]